MELRQLIQIQRASSRVRDENAGKNEHPSEERVQSQLHRAVLLVGRPENGDEKVLRHDDQFVECEEQKQIGTQENAVTASDN